MNTESVSANAQLGLRPWGRREFAVTDHDGTLLTFCERQADA
jgi:hypothetical protein